MDILAVGGGGAEPDGLRADGGSVVQSAYDAMPGQIFEFFTSHPMLVVMILLTLVVGGSSWRR